MNSAIKFTKVDNVYECAYIPGNGSTSSNNRSNTQNRSNSSSTLTVAIVITIVVAVLTTVVLEFHVQEDVKVVYNGRCVSCSIPANRLPRECKTSTCINSRVCNTNSDCLTTDNSSFRCTYNRCRRTY